MAIQSYLYQSSEEPAAPPKTYQILVADDNRLMVDLLGDALRELGHNVLPAYDGQAAVRLAHEHRPHLIVLDVNMPMTGGFKAFEFLRSSAATARIPVIFITGEMSANVYPFIEGSSRVAYVKKPFDLDSFNSLVQQFLRDYSHT
jgi:CheY-like chemotaxis protein